MAVPGFSQGPPQNQRALRTRTNTSLKTAPPSLANIASRTSSRTSRTHQAARVCSLEIFSTRWLPLSHPSLLPQKSPSIQGRATSSSPSSARTGRYLHFSSVTQTWPKRWLRQPREVSLLSRLQNSAINCRLLTLLFTNQGAQALMRLGYTDLSNTISATTGIIDSKRVTHAQRQVIIDEVAKCIHTSQYLARSRLGITATIVAGTVAGGFGLGAFIWMTGGREVAMERVKAAAKSNS